MIADVILREGVPPWQKQNNAHPPPLNGAKKSESNDNSDSPLTPILNLDHVTLDVVKAKAINYPGASSSAHYSSLPPLSASSSTYPSIPPVPLAPLPLLQ